MTPRLTRYASAQDAARAAAEAAQRIRGARETIAREEPILAEARQQFDAFLGTEPRPATEQAAATIDEMRAARFDDELPPLRAIGLTVVPNGADTFAADVPGVSA